MQVTVLIEINGVIYICLTACLHKWQYSNSWISQASGVANCYMEVINLITWEKSIPDHVVAQITELRKLLFTL